jgi:serine/threonine protein kinase
VPLHQLSANIFGAWCSPKSPRHYVALKILRTDSSEESKEPATARLSHKHIVALIDHFWHDGSNGRHLCLVFEPMGPSTTAIASELPHNKPRQIDKVQRYPVRMAKKQEGPTVSIAWSRLSAPC